jgi:putative spermidine/putrescine transport system permease protein
MLPAYASPMERLWYYTLRVLCALIIVFLVAPVLVIMPLSFNANSFLMYPMAGFSLRWYEEFFHSATWQLALKNSLIVTPAATLLAVVLGTLASIGLTRVEFRGKALLTSILISPMVVPVVIAGVAVYLFFAPLGLTGSYVGLILAHAALGVPFVITTVTATLQGFDYNLVRAAASLGANPVTTFFKVTLPIVAPGVVSGALFAFATSFDEVVVTLFLASPEQSTLPRQMFSGIRDNISPTIAAVASLLILLATLLLLVLELQRRRTERLRGGGTPIRRAVRRGFLRRRIGA